MHARRWNLGVAGVALVALIVAFSGCEAAGPAIGTARFAVGTTGVAYSNNLVASGGKSPYTWSATGLPAGIAVHGSKISGTPTATGTFTVTLKVKGADNATSSRAVKLFVQQSLEAQLFDLINAQRTNASIPKLTHLTEESIKAHDLAVKEAKAGAVSHTPAGDGQPSCATDKGENVAAGTTLSAIMTAWMASKIHRDNILGTKYSRLGTGVAFAGGKYWVAAEFIGGC